MRLAGIVLLLLGAVGTVQGVAWLGRPGPRPFGLPVPRAVAGTLAALAGLTATFAGLWLALE